MTSPLIVMPLAIATSRAAAGARPELLSPSPETSITRAIPRNIDHAPVRFVGCPNELGHPGGVKPLHGAARLSISQVTSRGDVILIGDFSVKRDLSTASAHLVLNFRDAAPPSPRGVLANATPRRFPLRLITRNLSSGM